MLNKLNTSQVLEIGSSHLGTLSGHIFDLLTVSKPITSNAAVNLSKVVSKLSPLLGNLIEFNSVEFLNDREEFKGLGEWKRQDPGFPDTVFTGVDPTPGFEIKAWFPLATEMTARFKDSQDHFVENNTNVCVLAWLPEHIIYGKPYILDVVVVSGASVAHARDTHYHNPPDYLVLEPEDTSARTRNLQQTNTSGYKIQTTDADELERAARIVESWGQGGKEYKTGADYQRLIRQLHSQFTYRQDTNYAKMDRIVHADLEAFKSRVMETTVHGLTVKEWDGLFRSNDRASTALAKAIEGGEQKAIQRAETAVAKAEARVKRVLREHLGITEGDPEDLVE